jgi:uncharacterized membrane protein YozB (DUF420 family)
MAKLYDCDLKIDVLVYGMINIILSAATFAAVLLLYGAFRIWRRDGIAKQSVLMLVAALVIIANLAIWTVPDKNGNSLIKQEQTQ